MAVSEWPNDEFSVASETNRWRFEAEVRVGISSNERLDLASGLWWR
jgi:hypothetical protein